MRVVESIALWLGRRRVSILLGLVMVAGLMAGAGAQEQKSADPIVPPPAATGPAPVPVPATAPAPAPASPEPAASALPGMPIPAAPPPSLFKPDVAVKVPSRPDDPRAAKTYALLETYCARCHQTGKTDTPLTSGLLSNILAVDDLARDPMLVRPGLPDASKLYDVFVTRHAPLSIYGGNTPAEGPQTGSPQAGGAQAGSPQAGSPQAREPEPGDIEAVRSWIKDLTQPKSACDGRKRLSAGDVDKLALETAVLANDDARDLRFISLASLYNVCAPPETIAEYRQAVIKLLNSLSWSGDPVQIATTGPEGVVINFKLADLGWVSGHWDILQRIYPAGLQSTPSEALKTATATDIPVFRADWFADAASKPPLYYALLGIPAKLSDLAKINGIDIDLNVKAARARRMAVRTSAVTRGNRLVERHEGGRGALWLVYDFASSAGDQDLFDHPLGPKAGGAVKHPFKPDTIRVIFTLPNGFLGYALYDAAGNRIDRVLPGVENPLTGGESIAALNVTRAGANCFACHTNGLRVARDDLRAVALSDKFKPSKDVKDAALALYAADAEVAAFTDGDIYRYRNALKAAGLDADLLIGGLEPINALARRYLAGADAALVAAEAGVEIKSFQRVLAEAPTAAIPLARRLQHGVLERADIDRLLGALTAATEAGPAKPAAKPANAAAPKDDTGAVKLSLWVDKPSPAPGDVITVNAEADSDCFLTLLSIDAAGKATVLYPNDFEPDNLLTAGKAVRVPGPEAPYQLRVKAAGQEMLMAQCSTSPVPPSGIEHDFEKQRFTVLGNWENFVHEALTQDAENRRNPEKAERQRAARANSIQRVPARGDQAERRPDLGPGRLLRDGRAVIVIGNG